MSWRMERIGEQLRGELARLLRDEVSDPRIGLVTLTRVEVAPDLSAASIFWSQLARPGAEQDAEAAGSDEADIREADRGLKSAAGFLRSRIARELSLRRTPELRFRHDPSIARGAETLSLIRELNEERAQREISEDPSRDASEPTIAASPGAEHDAKDGAPEERD